MQPQSGPSAVKSYKTILPAATKDVYYRDEIGNISTSHLRDDNAFVELELHPRCVGVRFMPLAGFCPEQSEWWLLKL